jgi:hypothetical protein
MYSGCENLAYNGPFLANLAQTHCDLRFITCDSEISEIFCRKNLLLK